MKGETVGVRPYNEATDLEAVLHTWHQHKKGPDEELQRELKLTSKMSYVCVDTTDLVVGFTVFRPDMNNYIAELFVFPTGKGYGAELLDHLKGE